MLSKDLGIEVDFRVPVILYNSPNDFSQTNVTLELIEESVGGFTEILKNRMYPRLEITNVSLGSRPYFKNNQRGRNNRNFRNYKNKIEIVSNIAITLQTKSYH